MPSLDPKTLEQIGTYITLVERIGSFHAQLAAGAFIKRIQVEYHGEITAFDTKPSPQFGQGNVGAGHDRLGQLRQRASLGQGAGLRDHDLHDREGRGLRQPHPRDGRDRQGEARHRRTVTGKKDLRVVELDGNDTDFCPGNMIWMEHEDRPGMVGKLGTILSENNVNIAGLHVGRQTPGPSGGMVNVDSEVSEKVLGEILDIPHIQNLKFIKF
jgi:D-3-phosphoglycerate dehydrogenase